MVPDRRWVSDSNMDGNGRKTARDYSGPPGGIRLCDTSKMTIVLIAVAFYLLAGWLVMRRMLIDRSAPAGFWLLTALSAVALHVLVHVMAWRQGGGVDLHFFAAMSLVGLGMAALTTAYAANGRLGALGVVVYPIAAASLLGYALGSSPGPRNLDWRVELHVWLALLAYAALAIAAKDRRVVIACLIWLIALYPLSAVWH